MKNMLDAKRCRLIRHCCASNILVGFCLCTGLLSFSRPPAAFHQTLQRIHANHFLTPTHSYQLVHINLLSRQLTCAKILTPTAKPLIPTRSYNFSRHIRLCFDDLAHRPPSAATAKALSIVTVSGHSGI